MRQPLSHLEGSPTAFALEGSFKRFEVVLDMMDVMMVAAIATVSTRTCSNSGSDREWGGFNDARGVHAAKGAVCGRRRKISW